MSEESLKLCINCSTINDSGKFCFNCGKPLSIATAQLDELLLKRLSLEGFTSLDDLLHDNAKLSELALIIKKEAANPYNALLISASGDLEQNALYALYVVGIVHAGKQSVDEINDLAIKTSDMIKAGKKKVDLKVSLILFRFYVIYEDGCPPETIRGHKFAWYKRISFKTGVRPKIVVVNCETKKVYGADRYFEPDHQVKLATAQLEQSEQQDKEPSFYRKFARLMLDEPIQKLSEYMEGLALIGAPPIIAHRITSNKLAPKDLAGMMGISAFLSAIIAGLFHIEIDAFNTGYSLLDDFLENFLIISTSMVWAFFVYWPLKVAKGKADFKSTFIASAYIGAVSQPMILLFVGMLLVFGVSSDEAWKAAPAGSLTVAVPVFSALHRVSVSRVMVSLSLFLPLAILVIGMIVFMLFLLLR
jgi:hypothetical protein